MSSPTQVNSSSGPQDPHPTHSDEEPNPSLEQQLDALRAEKATLESQYGALLGKLTTMRNTLGDKLRQDADELDRREQQIGQLQAQNEELLSTTETLKSELIASNEETDHLHHELDQIRSRMMESQRHMESETYEREEAYREAREEVEWLRSQLEDNKRELMNESVRREQAENSLKDRDTAMASLIRDIELLKQDRDFQAESANNLQSVLEEFQLAKDAEIQSVVSDTQNRLVEAEKKLAIYQQKALVAETKLAANESAAVLCESLKKEVKEKSLLIGKIRHEAVILNEHLTEALRRLRRDNNEHSVDRRLVTNVLLSFILTPREDTKRFEMLSLLASILSWNDDQREQVGLQRASSSGRAAQDHRKTHTRGGQGRASDDTLGDSDTITDQWVSFLLREANAASPSLNSSFSALDLSSSSPTHDRSQSNAQKTSEVVHIPSSPGSSLSTLSAITRPTSDSP